LTPTSADIDDAGDPVATHVIRTDNDGQWI
jgi:hypothetical protein